MSWNKKTVNRSVIDGTISVLKNLGTPYKVTVLGKVIGLGLEDGKFEEDIKGMLHSTHNYYKLRKLEYKDVVILEKIIRNNGCDLDDIILSFEFVKGCEPSEWAIEETNE